MHTNWSERVQSIYTLDSSRDLRFTKEKLEEILKATRIDDNMNILEIGCGTGVLTRKLAKRLSEDTTITGLDMDKKFIDYCKSRAKEEDLHNVNYVVGNALSLPFEDNTFDGCTSHTVIEHVPNKEFLKEQYRVCKEGGYVSIMNIRPQQALMSEDNLSPSEREKELLGKISSVTKVSKNEMKVGKFFDNPQNIMKLFDEIGFKDIQLDAITYIKCIDDNRNSIEGRKLIIESERRTVLDFVNLGLAMKEDVLKPDEKDELVELINSRYDKRMEMLESDTNLWDFSVSPMIVISGRK